MEEASLGTETAEQRRRRMKQRVETERRAGRGSGSFSSTKAQAAAALDARRTRELKIAPRARLLHRVPEPAPPSHPFLPLLLSLLLSPGGPPFSAIPRAIDRSRPPRC